MSQSTLPKKLASVKPGTLFVGVDLALDRNVAVVMDERAKRLDRFRFDNDLGGCKTFHRRLRQVKEKHQALAVLVGMEPTNYFWKLQRFQAVATCLWHRDRHANDLARCHR
jgi:hypothetical protein